MTAVAAEVVAVEVGDLGGCYSTDQHRLQQDWVVLAACCYRDLNGQYHLLLVVRVEIHRVAAAESFG